MTSTTYKVEVQPDFLKRHSKTPPIQAVAELIWNSLDADADLIDVSVTADELGMAQIVVQDNGHGITFSEAPHVFSRLGGSWKMTGQRTKSKHRFLHGAEGRGRFKVFALGRVAIWTVKYLTDTGVISEYSITIREDDISKFFISEQTISESKITGVKLFVTELQENFRLLLADNVVQELTETFALYLKNYRDTTIRYEGTSLVPDNAIVASRSTELKELDIEGLRYPVHLEIIEWRKVTTRTLYLCNQSGFPLSTYNTRFRTKDFQFTAYLKSAYVANLFKEGMLDMVGEMNPHLQETVDDALQVIKTHFRDRASERARDLVDEWKTDNIYPFEGEAQSVLESAERKVFDILATTASDYMPDFGNAPLKKKKFDLRMLRTAIEKSPEELQIILKEVLDLPKQKQDELARLLKEASLASIISASRVVADRLKFLTGLEQILFDTDMKKRLKERSQLHKIIEDNTWLFGEAYSLSVSDRGLTAVLRKHLELGGEDVVIDRPVQHVSKKRGIVDLMFSRALRRHRAYELEHLVVELKRPKFKIDGSALTQVEQYALSIANDERFRSIPNVKWMFWVISDDTDEFADFRRRDGGVTTSKDNISVGVKTWGELIEENKARLQFYQEKLELQVDDEVALKHLQDKYQKFLTGVIAENETTSD